MDILKANDLYKLFNSKRKIISINNKIHCICWNYNGIKYLLTSSS